MLQMQQRPTSNISAGVVVRRAHNANLSNDLAEARTANQALHAQNKALQVAFLESNESAARANVTTDAATERTDMLLDFHQKTANEHTKMMQILRCMATEARAACARSIVEKKGYSKLLDEAKAQAARAADQLRTLEAAQQTNSSRRKPLLEEMNALLGNPKQPAAN
jgi:predicted membrane-bound mannosyltransferase